MIGDMLKYNFASAGGGPGDFRSDETLERRFGDLLTPEIDPFQKHRVLSCFSLLCFFIVYPAQWLFGCPI